MYSTANKCHLHLTFMASFMFYFILLLTPLPTLPLTETLPNRGSSTPCSS